MSFGELFLQNPELFPARQSGESWGERSLAVDFVGGPYHFHGLDVHLQQQIREWFDDYADMIAVGQRGIETRVFRANPSDFLDYDRVNINKSVLDMKFAPNAVSIVGLKFMARIELDPVLKGAIWISCEDDHLNELGLKNYFRILAAYRLHLMGGALLHSAAIVREGDGYVFIGESGAGKTTLSLASIEAGLEVLSDDLNAIIPRDGGLVVKKVPFTGTLDRETSAQNEAPLRLLGLLQKGASNRIDYDAATRAQAIASLMASVPFVNSDPYQFDQLLCNIETFLQATPLVIATTTLGGNPNELLQSKPHTPENDLMENHAHC